MKKLLTLITVYCVLTCVGFSQEVVSSAGGYGSSTSGSLSWTLGEPVIETFLGANYTLTQGFHQTNLTITSIEELPDLNIGINAYPVPTKNMLNIDINDAEKVDFLIKMYNLSGKAVIMQNIDNAKSIINVQNLPAGAYILKISNNKGRALKTFKMIKE
jgi:hypothetical protein